MAFNWFSNPMPHHPIDPSPLQTLIYYCSVSVTSTLNIVAELVTDHSDKQLPKLVLDCLPFLPPYHYQFSFTANMRMLACIIEGPFIYSAIADEALCRSSVFSFLQDVRREFLIYAEDKGIVEDQGRLKSHSLDRHFKPIFRRLVSPHVGLTQLKKNQMEEDHARQQAFARAEAQAQAEANARREVEEGRGSQPEHEFSIQFTSRQPDIERAYESYDPSSTIEKSLSGSRSPSTPLINRETVGNGTKQRKSKPHTISRGIKFDVGAENNGNVNVDVIHGEGDTHTAAHRKQFINLKCILLVDVVVCVVLFGIWLGVCKGFKCTTSS